MYSVDDIMQYVEEEDVKFIKLAFCDVYGNQKNISIMPHELKRAFEYGIAIDAVAIKGFGGEVRSDLFLFPEPDTITILPWRPTQGKVVRMFCQIKYPDGSIFECDTRNLLIKAINEAKKLGLSFYFGSEIEFYLFKTDEEGNNTKIPYDKAGYMDVAPNDKGENVRREICLTLVDMGILPESSHHEEGPGQNEIDFKYSDPLSAADNAITFKSVVKTVAARNGLCADFSPKPIPGEAGNGYHINLSVKSNEGKDLLEYCIAGILKNINSMTLFLNSCDESYNRLGEMNAPKYITWSNENRSQLIRVPAAKGEYRRIELRSADGEINPYIAFTLIIYAAIDGIVNKVILQEPSNFNLYTASDSLLKTLKLLPRNLNEAKKYVVDSEFVKECLPLRVINDYLDK